MRGKVIGQSREAERDTGALSASKKFGSYKGERPVSLREADVKELAGFQQLMSAWDVFLKKGGEIGDVERCYSFAESVVSGLESTPELVERLSIAIQKSQGEGHFDSSAGFFLSALMNTGEGNNYTIHSCPAQPICWLAYNNIKDFVVEGNVGCFLARQMKGGKVVINGNLDHTVGEYMTGGEIIINGNADELLGKMLEGGTITCKGNAAGSLGNGMRSGKIVVHGNVGNCLGSGMSGGEIHVHGEIADQELDRYGLDRGKIYHKGKLRVDK
jgi:hypothetical protein